MVSPCLRRPSRMFDIEPPIAIRQRWYRCDTKFHVDMLAQLMNASAHDRYGVVLVSGNGGELWEVTAVETKLVRRIHVQVGKKHKKGGQSSARFGRLADEQRSRVVDRVVDDVKNQWWDGAKNKLRVEGLIVAGPGDVKLQAMATDEWKKWLRTSVLDVVNTNAVSIDEVMAKIHLESYRAKVELSWVKEFEEIMEQTPDLVVFGVEVSADSSSELHWSFGGDEEQCTRVAKTIEGKAALEKYGGRVGVRFRPVLLLTMVADTE